MGGLGSDTAGSIRIPAALCGTTGLKPTFGRVSVAGTIPLAPSLDHVGPMARSAADCAAILAAIAGLDPADPTTVAEPVPDYLRQLTRSLDGIRLGVFVTDDLRLPAGADAAAVLAGVVHLLADAGVELEDVVLPDYAATTAATRVILAAEAFDFHHEVMQRRWAEYSRSTRTRIGAGALCTGADLVLAEDQRRHSRRTLAQLFQTVDVVVMPTVSTGAPRYGPGETLDSAAMAATAHTRYANSVGYPVLALPCGFTADGLPLSVQLMGRPFEESLLLAIGASYQQRTDWHLRDPAMTPATNPRVSAVPAAHGELPDGSRGEHVQSVFAAAGILCEEDLPALTDAYSAHRADIEVLREARARRR
jgi:aspartyl-tRNA(Asn)/glutamyl-tRNA(Gln) amidotransferase subunit A